MFAIDNGQYGDPIILLSSLAFPPFSFSYYFCQTRNIRQRFFTKEKNRRTERGEMEIDNRDGRGTGVLNAAGQSPASSNTSDSSVLFTTQTKPLLSTSSLLAAVKNIIYSQGSTQATNTSIQQQTVDVLESTDGKGSL